MSYSRGYIRRRQWHPTPVLLPGKSHGWTSLVGCIPWGHEESDMSERLHFHFSLLCIGEGNGNPIQYSCLGNPMDRRIWWATCSLWGHKGFNMTEHICKGRGYIYISYCYYYYFYSLNTVFSRLTVFFSFIDRRVSKTSGGMPLG